MGKVHFVKLSLEEASAIAHEDAIRAYRTLSGFIIESRLEADGWHIEYELKNPYSCGGGLHYLIDADTGEILRKVYNQ